MSVFAIERVEAESAREKVTQVASSISSALERRASANSAYLIAGAAYIAENPDLSPQQFGAFTQQLSRDAHYETGEGMGWSRVVRRGEEGAFVAAMRARGYPDFRIFPAAEPGRTTRVPLTYIAPDTPGARMAAGFDLYSEPVRRAALDQAAGRNAPIATGRMNLIRGQRFSGGAGFVMYMPVYAARSDGSRLVGFISSSFPAAPFLSAALTAEQRGTYSVRLWDGAANPDRLMAQVGPGNSGGAWRLQSLTVASRPMTLGVEAPKAARLSNLALLTLVFGLIAGAMILVVIRLITRQAIADRTALDWLEEQSSIRNSLTRELNHRVKNTLANVLSIISLTRRRASNLDEFSEALMGRVSALSATHDLLTQSEWGTTPIRAVVDAELAPYIGAAEGTVATRGPEVEIAPNDALSLGLALHELATNASKFGALSVPTGTVEVHWELVTQSLARVVWEEHGGPPVAADNRRGFGTELIERIVAHELGTTVDLRFDPGGVVCTLLVPVRLPINFKIRADRG